MFVRDGADWVQQAELIASDGASFDYFGGSVAISGETVVVGADSNDGIRLNAGAAYVFVRSGASWAQQVKLTANDATEGSFFGTSVSISDGTVVAGADGAGLRAGSNIGAAYVFVRSGTAWSQQAKLGASDAADGDFFGGAVSVLDGTVIVGARGDDDAGSSSGSAYVFVRDGSVWTEQAKLAAADGASGDFFGFSIAVSGEMAVVGAPSPPVGSGADDPGGAYVFVRSGSVWTEQAKLAAADGAGGDSFGGAVSVSDGTAVIGSRGPAGFGSPGGSGSSSGPGAAYVFARDGASWTQRAKLTADDGMNGDLLGASVAVSKGTVFIGAPEASDVGGAYVFTPAVAVGGPEGYYLLAAPADATTVGSFFGPVWTQCFPGADYTGAACGAGGANVSTYDEAAAGGEGNGYVVASASDALPPGRGVYAYLYADDDASTPAVDGRFPKALPLAGDEPALPFAFSLTYTDAGVPGADNDGDNRPDDGWNLLGNPLRRPLDWPSVYQNSQSAAASSPVNPTAYVYQPGAGYLTVNGNTGGGTLQDQAVPVGRGFFVLATRPDATLTVPANQPRRSEAAPAPAYVSLRLVAPAASGREVSGSVYVAVQAGAALGADPDDGPLPAPLGAPHLTLGVEDADGAALLYAALPDALPTGTVDLPLVVGLDGVGTDAALTPSLALPDGWTAALVDRRSGAATPLADGAPVAVDLAGTGAAPAVGRWALRLSSGSATPTETGPAAAAVSLVRPNPAAGRATLRLSVPGAERVRVSVVDALGREVAVAFDGEVSGLATVALDTSGLAPGAYVVRVVGPSVSESRRLTVVR